MRPGLDAMRALCAALGDPQKKFRAIHVAGTNGKGAVCALLSAALKRGSGGMKIGRYTSPHLVKLNERFCINDQPLPDDKLERYAKNVEDALRHRGLSPDVTFFANFSNLASGSGWSFMQNRSLSFTRCGEVYRPTTTRPSTSAAESSAHTAPLPFVPATWMARNRFCGSPSAAQSARMASRPGLMPKRRRAARLSIIAEPHEAA